MSNEEHKDFESSDLERKNTVTIRQSIIGLLLLVSLGLLGLLILISKNLSEDFNYQELLKNLLLFSSGSGVALLIEKKNKLTKQNKVIRKTPGICGGYARIRNTRIPVWTLVSLLQQGATEQELLRNYPTITLNDLTSVREYYYNHQSEIGQIIKSMDE